MIEKAEIMFLGTEYALKVTYDKSAPFRHGPGRCVCRAGDNDVVLAVCVGVVGEEGQRAPCGKRGIVRACGARVRSTARRRACARNYRVHIAVSARAQRAGVSAKHAEAVFPMKW